MPMTDAEILERLQEPGAVIIVGSNGRMGKLFMDEGRRAGLGMGGLARPYRPDYMRRHLTRAAVVMLSVPAMAFDKVLGVVCPYLDPECVLTDVTSVKVNPMFQMERAWRGSVVGTHPLFGPEPDRNMEQFVTVTRGKTCSEDAVNTVKAVFTSMGFRTFETTAEEHDSAMAKIQNMNFITTLAYLAQTACDDELLPYITPSFSRRLVAAHKMLTEDGEMFAGLFEANPFSQKAVRQFSKILSLASAGDIDLLLDRARWWWRKEGSL